MKILFFVILTVCPVFASFTVDCFWKRKHSHQIEDNWILVSKLADLVSKEEGATPKFAVIPVAAIRHRNKGASEIASLYLCVDKSSWGDYEIEKSCTIRFLASIKELPIPKGEKWLFESAENAIESK